MNVASPASMVILQWLRLGAVTTLGHIAAAWRRGRVTLGGWLWAPILGRLALWLGLFLALAHVGAGTVGRLVGLTPMAAAAQQLSGAGLAARDTDDAVCADGSELGCAPPRNIPADAGAEDGSARTDAGAPPGRLPDGRIVLNVASEEELVTLPGIGPKRARAIIVLRTKLGRFRRPEDLLRVRGIGPKAVARLRPRVVVDPPADKPAPP